MQNINPYDQHQFQQEFEQTQTYQILKEKYDYIVFEKFFESRKSLDPIPRKLFISSQVSAVPWYYLNFLDTSEQTVDLGCGMNFFKPYFPNVIGIDKNPTDADIVDTVNDEFFTRHINAYHSVFSINALHYLPIGNLRNICINFSNMIKPGGRGFLSLNVQRMLEKTTTSFALKGKELEAWIRQQFDDFPCELIVLDIDTTVINAFLDGNIRVVFSK